MKVSSASALGQGTATGSLGNFRLTFDGLSETARLRGVAAKGQSTLTNFFRSRPLAAPVEEEDGGDAPSKRARTA